MSIRDIHKKSFSQETITKLEIFEAYLREWLPVFIHNPHVDEVNICDFFAGTGADSIGVFGSPLRIMNVIEEYRGNIFFKKLKIKVVFNEYINWKFKDLCKCVQERVDQLKFGELLEVEYHNEDFKKLFPSVAKDIKEKINLIFLDQNGIKQITPEVFTVIESFGRTDFMFFIASSYFNRFMDTKEFQNYFPDLDVDKIKDIKHKDLHRFIIEYYRGKLPNSSKTRLCPFTIKKAQNIYGLIFGSKNALGIQKFLEVAWNKNKVNGEANFDIDDDIKKQQAELFPEMKKKTKIENFQDDIKDFVLSSKIVTNFQMYNYALDNGFLPAHVSACMRRLRNEKIIAFNGHARISYEKCYKNPEEVKFEVIK